MRPRLNYLTDSAVVFLLTALLIAPLFTLGYLTNWGSIESTFIADARFLLDHWPHPRWQPLWYEGTRWDYIYPPALRYGTAVTAAALGDTTARGYHVYTGLLYCLGIAGVYLLARMATASRKAAFLTAALAALISPSYLFMTAMRNDAPWLLPQRLRVLIIYGEGPHVSSLCLLPFAIVAAFRALQQYRPLALVAAAAFSAAVVAHNFYGATALAVLFPVLVWSVWITQGGWGVWIRSAAVAVLAYGFTAFWLVPSYFRVTRDNLKLVATPGNTSSLVLTLVLALAFAAWSWHYARRRPDRAWAVFTAGSLAFFSLNVLGHTFWGFRVTGEPHRLTPELDILMLLGGVMALRALWRGGIPRVPRTAVRAAAAVAVIAAFLTGVPYLRHAWTFFPEDNNPQARVEYRVSEWMHRHAPQERAFVTGSVRFWYNAWHDLPQLGGGSEQGLLNQGILDALWNIRFDEEPSAAILWTQAFGTGLIYVPDKQSEEWYHDYPNPRKFDGVLPVLWDDGRGNRIFRVPRRYPAWARVVRTEEMQRLEQTHEVHNLDWLKAYVAALENGPPSEPSFHLEGADRARIRVKIAPGETLLAQFAFDPNWVAESAGRPLRTRRDPLGQMLVEVPPGDHDIRLSFPMPLENRAGWLFTGLSLAASTLLAAHGARRRATARRLA